MQDLVSEQAGWLGGSSGHPLGGWQRRRYTAERKDAGSVTAAVAAFLMEAKSENARVDILAHGKEPR